VHVVKGQVLAPVVLGFTAVQVHELIESLSRRAHGVCSQVLGFFERPNEYSGI
jgi:hypothetical protein